MSRYLPVFAVIATAACFSTQAYAQVFPTTGIIPINSGSNPYPNQQNPGYGFVGSQSAFSGMGTFGDFAPFRGSPSSIGGDPMNPLGNSVHGLNPFFAYNQYNPYPQQSQCQYCMGQVNYPYFQNQMTGPYVQVQQQYPQQYSQQSQKQYSPQYQQSQYVAPSSGSGYYSQSAF